MQLQRVLAALIAAVVLSGCPSVEESAPAEKVAFATFDPNTGTIPTPNDLALQRAPAQVGLQQQLLMSFVANGGWPADQEVAVNIPITIRTRQANGAYAAPAAPQAVDLATVNDESVAFLKANTGAGAVQAPTRVLRCPTGAAPTTTCWEPSYANGVLTLRRNGPDGHRRWDAGGRYIVALRNTITADGLRLAPDQAIALIAPNASLANFENAPPGAGAATLATLEQLRGLYGTGRLWSSIPDPAICGGAGVPVAPCWLPLPAGANGVPPQQPAFEAVDTVFPSSELASIQTFSVQASTTVRPLTDSGSGQVPLPSDFLLDPASGKVRNVPAFGPAAAGLATLDGFSTTAPLFVPLTGAVKASTITRDTLRIYKITTAGPVQLRDQTALPGATPQIITQPSTTVANDAASTLVLAPAVPVQLPPAAGGAFVPVPPLDEKSQYLVVVTNGVTDAQDRPLRRSTLMDIVFSFTAPIFSESATATAPCAAGNEANCSSRIPGVSNADAAGLQRLRTTLSPVLEALNLRSCANNATCAVLAYTVKTQSVKDVSVQLAALPFSVEAQRAVFVPSGTTAFDTEAQVGLPAAAFPNVAKFVETTIPMVNAIQASTGAFDPALATPAFLGNPANLKPVKALVAIPSATGPASGPAIGAAPLCPGSTTIRCVPLVVFHHGLNGARYQMLAAADALAARGFVVAAIDAPYHGDRAFCTQNSDCVVAGGGDGVCTPNAALATPVDTTPPGTCTTGALKKNASLSTVASGNYFITSNFFRIRDGMRQDLLDHAILVHALARPPAAPVQQPAATPDFVVELATTAGIAVDPREVRYAGLSLGGMSGTKIAATNPRFKRVVLNVPGGTLVDVFTNSPAFQSRLAPIFAGLGVDLTKVSPTLPGGGANPNFDPAQAARYGQTLAIAKWVLDPADPINYAANVQTKVVPQDPQIQALFAALAAGGVGSTTTQAYGQMVKDDQVVMNPYNQLLLNLTGAPFVSYDPTAIPAESRHGLLLANFTSPAKPIGDAMRADLAAFLATGTAPRTGSVTLP